MTRSISEKVRGPSPPLDPIVLADLRQLSDATGGDLLGSLVALFSTNTIAGLAKIHDAVRAGAMGQVAAVAHGIRGSSGNIGALAMAQLCVALESAAIAGHTAAVSDVLGALGGEFDRVRAALDDEVAVVRGGGSGDGRF